MRCAAVLRRGVTIVELLVATSIIAIVAAIVTPAFRAALESAHASSAVSMMHQIGKAVSIYRSDWAVAADYSDGYRLGLPPRTYFHDQGMGLERGPIASPCGYKPGIGWNNSRHAPDHVYYDYFPDNNDYLTGKLRRYRDNAILVIDPWCNPSGTQWNNPMAEKRAIGLLVSGRVINRRAAGRPDHHDWWAPAP